MTESDECIHHEAISAIKWLVGSWTGEGTGEFPSIRPFNYIEEVVFDHVGQPMLNYRSFTKHPETLKPMHQEVGYLKVNPGTKDLAFCVSQNTGLVEIEEGSITSASQVDLKSTFVGRVSFGKEPKVFTVSRQYKLLDKDHMEMTLKMETSTQEIAKHLHVMYTRASV